LRFISKSSIFRGETPEASHLRHFLGSLAHHNIRLNPTNSPQLFLNLGIKPTPIRKLNIENLYFISSAARSMPAQIVPLLERMHTALTPVGMYKTIVEGIELGLVCFTEKLVQDNPAGFDFNMERLIGSRSPGLRIVQSSGIEDGCVRSYLLAAHDDISKTVEPITLDVVTTIEKGKKWSTARARLPWNSPCLESMLNNLFGCNWHYKYRPRFINSSDYHHVFYSWGFYESEDPIRQKLEMIQADISLDNPDFKERQTIIAAMNLDLVRAAENPNEILETIVNNLRSSIDSFPERPNLSDVRPEFYWDLGLARGQMLELNKPTY